MKKYFILFLFLLSSNLIFSKEFYSIHLSSERKMNEVNNDFKKFKKLDIPIFYKIHKIKNINWYRIFSGNFKTYKQAKNYGNKLLKEKKINYFLVMKIKKTKKSNKINKKKYLKN